MPGNISFGFFELGSDMIAIRGQYAEPRSQDQMFICIRIAANLDTVSGFTDDRKLAKAWANLTALWRRGVLSAGELDELQVAMYAFLIAMGLDQEGFPEWKGMVDQLGDLRYRSGRAPRPSGADSRRHQTNPWLGQGRWRCGSLIGGSEGRAVWQCPCLVAVARPVCHGFGAVVGPKSQSRSSRSSGAGGAAPRLRGVKVGKVILPGYGLAKGPSLNEPRVSGSLGAHASFGDFATLLPDVALIHSASSVDAHRARINGPSHLRAERERGVSVVAGLATHLIAPTAAQRAVRAEGDPSTGSYSY
jgi:hypothetical protein